VGRFSKMYMIGKNMHLENAKTLHFMKKIFRFVFTGRKAVEDIRIF
jgi:hypothetical protein